MHRPPLSRRPFLNGRSGYFVALVASGFSLFSFCVFPFADSCIFIFCSQGYFVQELSKGNALSWTLLAVVIITCIIALIGSLRTSSPALAISLIASSLVSICLFLWGIIGLVNTQVSFGKVTIDIGIWLCLFGMIVAAIGGMVSLTGARRFTPPGRFRESSSTFEWEQEDFDRWQ